MGHVACMEETRNAYNILVAKTEGKRPLGRSKCRWEERIGLTDVGWEGVDWIHVVQDRGQWRDLVNTVMNLRDS